MALGAVIKFVRKQDGTGTTLSTTYLGKDEDDASTRAPATWEFRTEGPLVKVTVSTYYLGLESRLASDAYDLVGTKSAEQYIDDVRTACNYRPYLLKLFGRGLAKIPLTHQGWGDVMLDGGTVLLANCTLESAEIIDNPGVYGVGVRFTFTKVASTTTP